MRHVERLIAHLGWADAKALASLRAAPTLDPAVRELYAHVLGAEHVWYARLTGTPQRVAVWPALTLDECGTLAAENLARLEAYTRAIRDDDLARAVTYRNSAGREFTSTVEDILLHVALHGAYHRGQIALALRTAGASPAPTDFIAFVRGAPAATRARA